MLCKPLSNRNIKDVIESVDLEEGEVQEELRLEEESPKAGGVKGQDIDMGK